VIKFGKEEKQIFGKCLKQGLKEIKRYKKFGEWGRNSEMKQYLIKKRENH
jgi:hypothetical protein